MPKSIPPLYKRPWSFLNDAEKADRETSLEALRIARHTIKPIEDIAVELGISMEAIKSNTNAIRKTKKGWAVSRRDRVPRPMIIYENGEKVSIEVNDSLMASLIGRYHSAISYYALSGNPERLLKFKGVKIRDSSGNYHTLETDSDTIIELLRKREEPEYFEPYDYGG